MKRSLSASIPRKLLCLALCLLLVCSFSFAALAAEDGTTPAPAAGEAAEGNPDGAGEGETDAVPPEEEPGPTEPVVVVPPYIDGDGTGAFLPNEDVTRASFLKMLVASLGKEFDTKGEYGSAPFYDVPLNPWYEKYLAYAWLNDLVSGYPDGSFQPNRPITRAEACAMAVPFLEQEGAELEEVPDSGFTDVEPDCWAKEQINQLVALGVIHGDGAGNFRPDDNLSRAEAVTIVSQLAGFLPTAEQKALLLERFPAVPFRDASAAGWYYPYLLRAVGYVETPPEVPAPGEEEEPPAEEEQPPEGEPTEGEPTEEQPVESQPVEAE